MLFGSLRSAVVFTRLGAYPTLVSTSIRWIERILPPVSRPAPGWHVSAPVDLLAYHFSWLWILVPLAFAGDVHPTDYMGLWAFGMTAAFLHRHFTMPYVYLDAAVFSQHVLRFTLFPAILMAGFLGSVFLYVWTSPPRFFIPADVALAAAALLVVAQVAQADRRGHRFRPSTMVAVASPYLGALAAGLAGTFGAHHALTDGALLLWLVVAAACVAFDRGPLSGKRGEAPQRAGGGTYARALTGTAVIGTASLIFGAEPLHVQPVQGSALVGAVGAFAAAWNIWHTLMQKFGILRVYAAKSAVPIERRAPAWVDRLFLFGAVPVLVAWLGPAQRDLLRTQYKSVTQFLLPVADALVVVQPVLLPLSAVVWAASIGCFVWHEWRADGLRTWPRLSMAFALTALVATFFVLSPLKVYAAYGFSHAVEYMVFVQAFLRRRYAGVSMASLAEGSAAHAPLIARLLRHPWWFWGVFSVVVGGAYFTTQFGRHFGLPTGGLRLLDVKLSTWFFAFAIWGSMAHFYFDGFLWKLRTPQVRANL